MCRKSLARLAALIGACAAASAAGAADVSAPPPVSPDQHVEIHAAPPPTDREQKTLAQLRDSEEAFQRHHALAPDATLRFRLYARKDPADLAQLRLVYATRDQRLLVPLDDHKRFTLDPAWNDRGAMLQTDLPDGTVAWKVEVRTPRFDPDEDVRRLGDLRLECESDLFHGNLQRGIRAPAVALEAASGKLCTEEDDAEIWFTERPLFGVTLVSGARRLHLPYSYVHVSDGSLALAGLFDWPYALRDRSYYLPLSELVSWPDDTRVEIDHMDDPQPPAPTSSAASEPAS